MAHFGPGSQKLHRSCCPMVSSNGRSRIAPPAASPSRLECFLSSAMPDKKVGVTAALQFGLAMSEAHTAWLCLSTESRRAVAACDQAALTGSVASGRFVVARGTLRQRGIGGDGEALRATPCTPVWIGEQASKALVAIRVMPTQSCSDRALASPKALHCLALPSLPQR